MEDPILQFFEYKHLPEHLQAISKPFCEWAQDIVKTIPRNPERDTGLRKLLEAQKCIVKAFLKKKSSQIECDVCENKIFIICPEEEIKINCGFCGSQIIAAPKK